MANNPLTELSTFDHQGGGFRARRCVIAMA